MKQAKEIEALKRKRNAVILAHLYQLPEIQDLADFIGDSLDLSRKARDTDADTLVFCGVRFMAETAKILSPQKTVLLPRPEAGCPMADMATAGQIARLRAEHPSAAVVCYVNSSAEVKAESDICCTSANALKVAASLKEKEIIFVPDRNLGRYVSRFLPDKRFIFIEGYCPVHDRILPADVDAAKARVPDAAVLAHPECAPEVLDKADFVGSTTQIIEYAGKSPRREFIIGTENGVIHRLKRLYPSKRFVALNDGFICPDMKVTTTDSVLAALRDMRHRIELEERMTRKASRSLERMLAIS